MPESGEKAADFICYNRAGHTLLTNRSVHDISVILKKVIIFSWKILLMVLMMTMNLVRIKIQQAAISKFKKLVFRFQIGE